MHQASGGISDISDISARTEWKSEQTQTQANTTHSIILLAAAAAAADDKHVLQ